MGHRDESTGTGRFIKSVASLLIVVGWLLFFLVTPAAAQTTSSYSNTCTIVTGFPYDPASGTSGCSLNVSNYYDFSLNGAGTLIDFSRITPASSQFSLGGIWSAAGYTCFGPSLTEQVVIQQTGTSYTAQKLTGDPCVPAGNTTFSGTIAPGPSLYVNLALGTPSSTGLPTQIFATATVATSQPTSNSHLVAGISLPPGVTTLQEAAADLNFSSFDWVQTINQWVNPDLFAANNPCIQDFPVSFVQSCASSAITAPPRVFDSVTGGYYGQPSQYAMAPPFYYNPNTSASIDSWSVQANTFGLSNPATGSASSCNALVADLVGGANLPVGSTLCFGDQPDDPELTATQIANGLFPEFTTELVGVCNSSTPLIGSCNANGYDPLFSWNWYDTYNGNQCLNGNNCIGLSANEDPVYPGGTGGITITEVDGVPVPEPSTILLLVPALAFLSFHFRRRLTCDVRFKAHEEGLQLSE